jgi:uncharacterized protein
MTLPEAEPSSSQHGAAAAAASVTPKLSSIFKARPEPTIFNDVAFTPADTQLLSNVYDYIKTYMSHYDASHDFSHIQRVLVLSMRIADSETFTSLSPNSNPILYDPLLIILSALLHDVGDRKYLKPEDGDGTTMVRDVLLSFGAQHLLAERVQLIASNVNYSKETSSPPQSLAHVRFLITQYPELAIVQDADRLDAIGAVGIGRCFTFGGAKGGRGMSDSVDHFEEKLLRIEGLMKTRTGKEMARERTERLRVFRGWWEEEVGLEGL